MPPSRLCLITFSIIVLLGLLLTTDPGEKVLRILTGNVDEYEYDKNDSLTSIELNGSHSILILTYHADMEVLSLQSREKIHEMIAAVENQLCYSYLMNYSYRVETMSIETLEREVHLRSGPRKFGLHPPLHWGKPLALYKYALTKNYEWVYWMDLDLFFVNFSVPLQYFISTVPHSASQLPLSIWKNNMSLIVPGHKPEERQFRSSNFGFLLNLGHKTSSTVTSREPVQLNEESLDFLVRWIEHDMCLCWFDQGAMWIEIAKWVRRKRATNSPKRAKAVCYSMVMNQTEMKCNCDFNCFESELLRLGYSHDGSQYPPFASFYHPDPDTLATSPGHQAGTNKAGPYFAAHKPVKPPNTCVVPNIVQMHGWSRRKVVEALYPSGPRNLEEIWLLLDVERARKGVEIAVSSQTTQAPRRVLPESTREQLWRSCTKYTLIDQGSLAKCGNLTTCLQAMNGPPARFAFMHNNALTMGALWTVWNYLPKGAWFVVATVDLRAPFGTAAPSSVNAALLWEFAAVVKRNFSSRDFVNGAWVLRKL